MGDADLVSRCGIGVGFAVYEHLDLPQSGKRLLGSADFHPIFYEWTFSAHYISNYRFQDLRYGT